MISDIGFSPGAEEGKAVRWRSDRSSGSAYALLLRTSDRDKEGVAVMEKRYRDILTARDVHGTNCFD